MISVFFSFIFSFILSCLVLSSLSSFSVFFLCLLSLSSFSVSPCDVVCVVVCGCVCLCACVVCEVCVVCVVCGVCGCGVCEVCCVVCRCGVCGVWHAENPVCRLKTPPCVHSKRPRVCRQHAHMLFNMCACCWYTRGRFERTHGNVLNAHTGGSSSVLLTKKSSRTVITCPRGSPKVTTGSSPQFQFENRSRTTMFPIPLISRFT